jgi:hypothetical protein
VDRSAPKHNRSEADLFCRFRPDDQVLQSIPHADGRPAAKPPYTFTLTRLGFQYLKFEQLLPVTQKKRHILAKTIVYDNGYWTWRFYELGLTPPG